MAEHPKVEYDELSEAAKGFIRPDSPPGARMAAARGLLPLVTLDLAILLCYLLHDDDPKIARQARRSMRSLPPHLLETIVASEVNWKVLDYLVRGTLPEDRLYERVLFNRAAHDTTVAWMATHITVPAVLDLIASNQERMIRHPAIVRNLVKNPHAAASTVATVKQFYVLYTGSDEMFREFEPEPAPAAVAEAEVPRPEIPEEDLEGLEKFEAIPEEEEGFPELSIEDLEKEVFDEEAAFADEFLVDPERELSAEERKGLAHKIRKLRPVDQMQLARRGNNEARQVLIKSPNKLVQECVIKNPRITIEEVMKIARDKSMREELIRMLTFNRDWTKNYQIRLNLTWNPKTPFPTAMKFLALLNEKDLAAISRSKQVPGMLAVAARKMVSQKQRYR